jgi:hypothetical protein
MLQDTCKSHVKPTITIEEKGLSKDQQLSTEPVLDPHQIRQ